ncbi:MAG TPA: helix-turn-helix domain-containing protein [Armatimonadota bacterium]|nr:helix-turn-helix domain-containing protein [Armatimonadota bacterium]
MRDQRYIGFSTGHDRDKRNPAHRVLRPAGTDCWILVYTLAGRARIHEPAGDFCVEPGDFLLIPAGAYQDYGPDRAIGLWEYLWVCFTPRASWPEGLLSWPTPAAQLGKITISAPSLRAELRERMAQAVQLGRSPLKRCEAFALNRIEDILLWCETVNPLAEEVRRDVRITRILHYLCEHAHEPIRVPHLAERCHLSASRFAHLFHAEMGQTPMQYLEAQRIAHARTLLRMTDAPISAVARQCGFVSHSAFSRIFKRYHDGRTPSEFRRG